MKDDPLAILDIDASIGFILAEEAALKKLVSGLKVPTGPPSRRKMEEVPVTFRWPSSSSKIQYPHIMIDFLSPPVPAYDRWTSVWQVGDDPRVFVDPATGAERIGMYYPSVSGDSMATTATSLIDTARPDGETKLPYTQTRFLPYDLYFQVSHWSRSVLHDRHLMSQFMVDIFPPRSFFLGIDADHTWRRCELIGTASLDSMETTEARKMMFHKAYTLKVEAEIPVDKVEAWSQVHDLHVDLYDFYNPAREAVGHPVDGPHNIALADYTVTGQ